MGDGQDVRVVIGVPLYNGLSRGHLPEAVSSLLGQAYPYVAFVFVDDQSDDGTFAALESLVGGDRRVHLERNPRRLGLVDNWRRAFERARVLFPTAEYFAWGSDHDRWHRRWLEALASELDRHPHAVMAYPRRVRIDAEGKETSHPQPRSPPKHFGPSGISVGEPGQDRGIWQ